MQSATSSEQLLYATIFIYNFLNLQVQHYIHVHGFSTFIHQALFSVLSDMLCPKPGSRSQSSSQAHQDGRRLICPGVVGQQRLGKRDLSVRTFFILSKLSI